MDDKPKRPQHRIFDHSLEGEIEVPAHPVEPASPFTPRPAEPPPVELNPLDLSSPALPAVQDRDRLRLATDAIIQQGLKLSEAADRFGVDPDALHVWHRTYVNFIGKDILTSSNSSPREKVEIDAATGRRFDENWDEMMRLAELERPQPSPLHQWLLRSPFTRWMFRDQRLDKLTVSGAAAVIAFTLLAIRAGTNSRGDQTDEAGASEAEGASAATFNPDDAITFTGAQKEALIKKVAEALTTFTQLETWQERLPYIRKRERVEPLMASYYEIHDDGPMTGLVVDPEVSFIKRNEGTFALVQGRRPSPDGSDKTGEAIIFLGQLIADEPGILFDWEVLVNYEPVSWPDFVASKSTQASPFRVRVSAGEYYNQPFMDREQFVSFAIRTLHQKGIVHAFAKRGSDLAKRLESAVAKELQANRAMILNLRYPENAKFNDVLAVESIVTDSWLGE